MIYALCPLLAVIVNIVLGGSRKYLSPCIVACSLQHSSFPFVVVRADSIWCRPLVSGIMAIIDQCLSWYVSPFHCFHVYHIFSNRTDMQMVWMGDVCRQESRMSRKEDVAISILPDSTSNRAKSNIAQQLITNVHVQKM